MIVCLVALAACGGGGAGNPTAQFKTGYAAARGPLNAAFSEVNKTLTGTPRKSATEIAATVGDLAARFGTELAPLEGLKPPARVATEFATLTTSLDRVESDLRQISGAAKRGSFSDTVLAVEKLDGDARSATDAAAAIKRKLYTT